jgi:hypothetical protein
LLDRYPAQVFAIELDQGWMGLGRNIVGRFWDPILCHGQPADTKVLRATSSRAR